MSTEDEPKVLDLRLPYSGTIRASLGSPVGPVVDLVCHPDGSVTWQYPDGEPISNLRDPVDPS